MDLAHRDTPRLAELYRTHRLRAVRIALRILRDPDEAEDIVQEVFARLFLRPVSFEGRAAFGTWLYRVMVNSSINSLRARRRGQRLELPCEPAPCPEEAAMSHQSRALFARAVREVGGRMGTVVYLRDLRGHSYPEIARLLDVPEGTVKSALHRGRQRALERMRAYLDERGGGPTRPSAPRSDLPSRGTGR